jgi:hypothetical protein
MAITDQIREMSVLPSRFNIMLEQALRAVKDNHEREELCVVACVVSSAAWRYWQAWRLPEDNRQEHEWVVFANVMKIAEGEGLTLLEKRIATAFVFTHDSFSIPRIMEQSVRDAPDEQKRRLKEEKTRQRRQHMEGGAENAKFLLNQLKRPNDPATPLFRPEEVQRCIDIVSKHDSWKVDPPCPPPTNDRLAVVCLEGDVLWPLHPIGVLADLERPDNEGMTKDFADPLKWREQLKQSLLTLVEFRPKWKNIPVVDFVDRESIFRTKEGHRLYSHWRQLWNLDGKASGDVDENNHYR